MIFEKDTILKNCNLLKKKKKNWAETKIIFREEHQNLILFILVWLLLLSF